MCGILATQTRKKIEASVLKESLSKIYHRGPDASNTLQLDPSFIFNLHQTDSCHVSFGHNRLEITGIDNGMQPIFNEDKSIYCVVNGEFYDFKSIRQELISKGHTFSTQTDSEILVHLYEIYGVNCLDYLHGEFAFALYDVKKNAWFVARDRFGIKPMNWCQNNGNLYFASEAKAFIPFFDLKLNQNAVWFSQNFQYLPQNSSIFEGINCVKPACFLWIDNKHNSYQIKEHIYYHVPSNITNDSMEYATEKIKNLLDQAVKKRIPEEVNFCAHLSGGIDSSSICSMAAQYNLKDAFTISFTDDDFYNEKQAALTTAKHLGLNLNVVEVNFAQIISNIPKAVYHAEGLSINGHLSGKYLLNKAISEAGFKVALSGEGSDEIFMGYSHLKQDFLSANSLSQMETNYLGGFQLPDGLTLDLQKIKDEFGFIPTWLAAKSSMAHKFSSIWSSEFIQKNSNPNSWFLDDFNSSVKDFSNYSPMKKSSMAWSKYCLSGYILKVLDDAQSMAFAVEGRLPFLDTELVNYALSLPDSYYFDGNIEKNILRKIFSSKLPASITQKTKQSFMSSPITKALSDKKIYQQVEEILNNEYFIKQNIFEKDQINKHLISWREKPNPATEPILMTLLCIASLCSEFKLER